MLANLQGGMAGGLSAIAGGGKGIPFSVAGTTAKPEFIPDVKGLATGLAGGALQGVLSGSKLGAGKSGNAAGSAIDALGGLLGKKKQ
jgi:hypothetical protein